MDIPSMFKNTDNKNNNLDGSVNINSIGSLNIGELSSMLNGANNDVQNDNTLLKIENTNINSIKNMMPLLGVNNTNNISRLLEMMEMKNLITSYKNTYNTLDKNSIPTLKKETLLYLKPNLKIENKPMVDMLIKVIEIGEILTERRG